MRKQQLITCLIAAAITIYACTDTTSDKKVDTASTPSATDITQRVQRGEYLVNVIGCDDCHSPKKMGAQGPEIIPDLRFSGYPSTRSIQKPDSNILKQGWILMGGDFTSFFGAWGMSFAANITSDETGIGNWTEENFIVAIRKGKYKGLEGSRDLLPPMPWFSYKNMTDEDLKSVFAYLKSTKPVKNLVPAARQLTDIP